MRLVVNDGSATSRVSRVARLTDLDIEAFNEVDLALYRISGDPNRCSRAVGTGDCPFHRDYTCHTVLADVEVVA